MIRNSGISLLCSIRAIHKRPRQACSRYYSSQTSNDDDEKAHLSRLASFADTISHDVLEKDQTTTKERKRQPQPTELPAFESLASGQNPREQVIVDAVSTEMEVMRNKEWTSEEEMRLIEVVEKCRSTWNAPINWNDVSRHFTHRPLNSCKHRYMMLMRLQMGEQDFQINIGPSRSWIPLAPKDKEAIEAGVRLYGERSWKKVATHVKNTTGVARSLTIIMHVWFIELCPKIRKAPPWNKKKTEELKELAKIHGKDPVFLSLKFFPEYPPYYLGLLLTNIKAKKRNVVPPRIHHNYNGSSEPSTEEEIKL